jgi:glucans biosynthesis protein C
MSRGTSSATDQNLQSGPPENAGLHSISAICGFSSICSFTHLLYVGLRALLPRHRDAAVGNPPSNMAITAYAVLLSAATFVIRIWYPQDRWIGFLGFIQMEPAHTAQYASLFAIGVYAGPRRWIETMPARRGMVWLAIGTGLAVAAYLLIGAGVIVRNTSSAWWVCTAESVLCTGLCVGLLVLFRELALGTSRLWRTLAANVLAVYVFHFPIVKLLQWALTGGPAARWLRLLMTIAGAVVGSFAFTNWVVLRLPYARRVL